MADINEHDFINHLVQSALRNPELKQKLLADPKGALETKLNFKLPEDFEVVVHQDTASKINIVLPSDREELTNLELGAVSGGVCWSNGYECRTNIDCSLDW